jgi:hypothetical protein
MAIKLLTILYPTSITIHLLPFHHDILTFIQVQAPAMFLPTDDQFFSQADPTKPDIAFLKNHFYREGRLTEKQALFILEK